MRIERLWYPGQKGGAARALSLALAPLSLLYRAGLRLRGGVRSDASVRCPVISVGNLTVGGNGKTPLVLELCRLALARSLRPAVVSRGYGRRGSEVRVVHRPGGPAPDWREAGDEPAFLARRCPELPIVVGRDRVAAARRAWDEFSPDVIVCDDGFQHRALGRDLDILAWNARRGAGNGRLLPAGPLREPLSAAQRAGLIVFVHAAGRDAEELRKNAGLPAGIPAVGCDLVPDGFVAAGAGDRLLANPGPGRWLGVCGIADPDGFGASLRQAGVEVAGLVAFRDHHPFSARDLARIERRRADTGAAGVITTEKDLARLEGRRGMLPPAPPWFALRLAVRWSAGAEREVFRRILERVEARRLRTQ